MTKFSIGMGREGFIFCHAALAPKTGKVSLLKDRQPAHSGTNFFPDFIRTAHDDSGGLYDMSLPGCTVHDGTDWYNIKEQREHEKLGCQV